MSTDLLGLIGNTPLVEIRNLNPNPNVRILAKLETANPGGSVKDRVACAMITAAEKNGELTPGKTIIEATSGNTGIGLAMVAAIKGYKMMLIMPETASEERKMIMRAYGAEIRLTPGHLATDGAIELAYRLAREEPDKYVLMDQYNNPASIEAHYNGTGLEIWNQTEGKVTHAVACLGTTGTVMGIAKRLHEMNPNVHVAGVEPNAGHKIQGLKNMHESYPPGIYDKKKLDSVLRVEDEDAFDMCRRLAAEEGILAGMSAGAAIAGAVKLADGLDEGLIVVIFPDGGERYLSTPLFAPREKQGPKVMDVARGPLTLNTASGLGVYTMGPSLDRPEGLDSWRRLVLLDVFSRYLAARGVAVSAAAGLADMDDRTLAKARELKLSRAEFVAQTVDKLHALADKLGISERVQFVPSHEGDDTTLELCRKLLGRGLAYEKLRSVYFDVLRDERYGKLSMQDRETLSAGKTVDLDAYVKSNPLDFTLLKRASLLDLKQGDVLETEWGNVRPSWFLQHAGAGLKALPRIDVFIGSESHRFPHLENMRAIWSVAGRELQAWMLDKLISGVEERTLDELLEEMESPAALRFWMLSTSYRKALSAAPDAVAMWLRNWRRVQEAASVLVLACGNKGDLVPDDVEQAAFDLRTGFAAAMDDDLSLHHFWPTLFSFVKRVNQWCTGSPHVPDMTGASAKLCLDRLLEVDDVLRIIDRDGLPVALAELPEAVQGMVADRQKARAEKDFAASDRLRDALIEAGYKLEDAATGVRVYRVRL